MNKHAAKCIIVIHLLIVVTGALGKIPPPCPPDGSPEAALLPASRDACTCADPKKEWGGQACCAQNANWNGTDCDCIGKNAKWHEWVDGYCCLIDYNKGWSFDRCYCKRGTSWNGNSCTPDDVQCPVNALYNGSACYCKEANWSSGTHRDVMVNGACCMENGYFEWAPVRTKTWIGECKCLGGFQWNGTYCVLTSGSMHMPITMRAGIGGGIGFALLLAISAALVILLCKAGNGRGVRDRLALPFTTPPNATGFLGHKKRRFPWCGGTDVDAGKSSKGSATQSSNEAPGLNASSGNIRGTALDLLRGNHMLSNTSGDSEGSPSDVVLVFVEEDAQASSKPASSTDNKGVVASHGGSGKPNIGRIFQNLWTRSKGSVKRGETLKTSRLGLSDASPGRLGQGRLERDKGGAEAHPEELWTRGVDPADVDILLDSQGQRVVLGRGAFAVVYLGRWQATLVAVKVMLATDSEAAQQEVQAEADILRGLRHPNVVLLMAVCISPGQQMMVILEYCGGGNLQKALQRDERNVERRLGWCTAHGKQPGNGYQLAVDIARGLAYLHHRQLIHFDIKPANVLLDHAWTHAKISDVGLSKCVHGSVVSATMRGTPAYMAPELMTFKHAPSYASDVYSFGVVLHHIITGEAPDHRQALRPLRVPEECSAAVASMYESCLQDDPKLRPTASEIVCMLEKEFDSGVVRNDGEPTPEPSNNP